MSPLDVLIVGSRNDSHSDAVIAELNAQGRSAYRYNLSDLRAVAMTSQDGLLVIGSAGSSLEIASHTTVWWHRTGSIHAQDLGTDEARLVADEGPHILRGSLYGAGVRWVDDPFAVARAEVKLLQLATARRLCIPVPKWLVTNCSADARRFAQSTRIVAKALSPGLGIAPYVEEVDGADLDLVGGAPVLLQAKVRAGADLRVVVIGDKARVWRRPRNLDTTDWRAEDPSGLMFKRVERPDVADAAKRLTAKLGLSMSVQDWLECARDPVFLEINPQGSWLFLEGAQSEIVPDLATHLAGRKP